MGLSRLIPQLQAILPSASILVGREDVAPYESDGLSAYRRTPGVVVLPRTEAEVAQILRLCAEAGVPVIVRGAGTGLSGGALPREDALLLGLAKLNNIVRIDPLARTARVQPGVRNLAISEAAAAYSLYYAPDPSSQIACTIGGNVAENSGGVHCLKYGLTVHNVLAVRALTIDGEVLEIGGDSLDSPGYDLLALLHGSEGLLAVITEVTVKLLPRPERAQVILAGFAHIETAAAAVSSVIGAGILPSGLEMMDQAAIQAAEAYIHAGYPLDAAAILLVEVDGSNAAVSEQVRLVHDLLMSSGATLVRTAHDEAERLKLWAGRKNAFPAVGRISPDYYCMDGTIPRRALPAVLHGIAQLSAEFGLKVANVFHAGDGNLHPLILYDANRSGELERTEALGGRILELCVAHGGTITGEHGVGVEKLDQMCVQFNAAEIARFHAVKEAFDPRGLLNPGKAIPTLQRCAELGAMHVHGGELPHPDIPRF